MYTRNHDPSKRSQEKEKIMKYGKKLPTKKKPIKNMPSKKKPVAKSAKGKLKGKQNNLPPALKAKILAAKKKKK